MTDTEKIDQLMDVIRVFEAAATKFLRKVDSGAARSTETYVELQAACKLATDTWAAVTRE